MRNLTRVIGVAVTSVAALATVCLQDGDAATGAANGVAAGVASSAPAAVAHRPHRKDPCGGLRPLHVSGRRYVCSFSDDFDGTTLDPAKWMIVDSELTGLASGHHDCYGPENVAVSGGAVHLSSRIQPARIFCHRGILSFWTRTTAASIATKDHFEQAYGRFEFRARFPEYTGSGIHSALWLYPADNVYGAWPNSGEIDVAEWFSSTADHVYPSLHYRGQPAQMGSTGSDCVVTDPWEYHRYAVEWTPDSMRFLYDGQECFSFAWTPARPLLAPQPFDQPFYVVLTQVWGVLSNRVTWQTPPLATMDVDWVRVWR